MTNDPRGSRREYAARLSALGIPTNEDEVVTSGSTDWAHGLAGRDAQIEQITKNILNKLGGAAPET